MEWRILYVDRNALLFNGFVSWLFGMLNLNISAQLYIHNLHTKYKDYNR